MLEKKPRFNVVPNLKDEIFFANQIDMRFFPDMFKIEFKQVNQQVDRIGDESNNVLIINRRTIALTPIMMKQLSGIINNIIQNYEKQHGAIKIPEVPKQKKELIKPVKSETYIG